MIAGNGIYTLYCVTFVVIGVLMRATDGVVGLSGL